MPFQRPGGKVTMRKVLVACLIAVLSAIDLGAQRQPAKSDQELLIELERNWNAAFYRKDTEFIEHILADEFIATYDDGRQGDKKIELSLVESFNQQVDSSTPENFVVKIYGDTAVVWF